MGYYNNIIKNLSEQFMKLVGEDDDEFIKADYKNGICTIRTNKHEYELTMKYAKDELGNKINYKKNHFDILTLDKLTDRIIGNEIHIERMKKWKQDNKEKVNEYNKQKYKENKDNILSQVPCECGSIVTKAAYNLHLKSKKHMRYINNI